VCDNVMFVSIATLTTSCEQTIREVWPRGGVTRHRLLQSLNMIGSYYHLLFSKFKLD
jgi:hypothetical protein